MLGAQEEEAQELLASSGIITLYRHGLSPVAAIRNSLNNGSKRWVSVVAADGWWLAAIIASHNSILPVTGHTQERKSTDRFRRKTLEWLAYYQQPYHSPTGK